jgi:CubicO group peptidase (beta-lactamase class C family)
MGDKIVRLIRPISAMLVTALLACPGAGASATAQALGDDALRACLAGVAAPSSFSGVMAVTRPGGTVSYAQGLMAGAGSTAIASGARFNLGSASKMFTAVAVAQLVDAGKVSLDDPIRNHVDGLTPGAGAVTVRQLLTHSSGLGNFFTPDNLPALEAARSLSDLKPLVVRERPEFPPGSRVQYSNSGFLLLGLMIEHVSGESYEDYLQRHIFAPSGMTASSTLPGSDTERAVGMTNMPEMLLPPPGGAPGQHAGPPGPPLGPPPGPPPGTSGGPNGMQMPPPGPLRPAVEAALVGNSAGGAYSNAADMQRFFAAVTAGKLTSAPMRDRLLSAQIAMAPASPNRPAVSHGLGFAVGTYNGHRWMGHNGGTLGVNVETATFPDDQTTIVIMANRDPPVATDMMRKVRAILFDGGTCT